MRFCCSDVARQRVFINTFQTWQRKAINENVVHIPLERELKDIGSQSNRQRKAVNEIEVNELHENELQEIGSKSSRGN